MMSFLLNALAALSIIGALQLGALANVRRQVRVQQVWMPLVSVLYVLVVLVVLYRFNAFVRDLLQWLGDTIPYLPTPRGTSTLYLLENVLVVTLFAALKLALRPALKSLFAGGREIGQSLVARVYEYSQEHDLWFVWLRLSDLRTYFRVLYWASSGIAVLYMALARTFGDWPGFSREAYPALAALVIGEFYFSIDGMTYTEFDKDVFGEQDRSHRVANFAPLRRILSDSFPGRVISDGVQLSSRAPLDSGFRIGELMRAESGAERLAGSYFNRLAQAHTDIDVNLVDASIQLMHGSSVLISSPFFPDLTPYLALPAYSNLLNFKKVLIISGRDSSADDLANWMNDGLEDITGVPGLWNTEMLGPLRRDGIDVGILRFGDVHNLDVLKANDSFFASVGYVILAEPARMMATGQLGLSLVLSRCSQGAPPAYAAFEGNYDGLVDALSHLLKVNLTEVVASALPRGASSEVVWRAEGLPLHLSIMPSVSRYLGLGTEIGAVALKYQVKRVQWIGGDAFPVLDMSWIAGQYFAQINSFSELDLSQDALREALVAKVNPNSVVQSDNSFLIVEDESANAFEAVRQFSTRATGAGFVNVISPNYLLRDYMIDNRDIFNSDAKAIPAVVADFARTERNAVLRLLLALVTFGVSRDEVAREFELIGISISEITSPEAERHDAQVTELLQKMIRKHTGVGYVSIKCRYSSDRSSRTSGDAAGSVFTVEPDPALTGVIKGMRSASFFVEDDLEDVNRIGSLLYGHVYQALLPGQFVTYAGKYYEVQTIGDGVGDGRVVLRRAADHIRDRRTYSPILEYALRDVRVSDAPASHLNKRNLEFFHCFADIEALSRGYYELAGRNAYHEGRRVEVDGIPARRYSNKALLAVRFPGIDSAVRITLALLLNELFVTVFPHSHEYVTAVTIDPEKSMGDHLPGLSFGDTPLPLPGGEAEYIFIVEDSMIDLGLVVAVERYWERFMDVLTDYLAWNAAPRPVSDPDKPSEIAPTFPERPLPSSEKSRWRRILRRLRRARPDERVVPTLPVDGSGEPDSPGEELDTGRNGEVAPEIEQGNQGAWPIPDGDIASVTTPGSAEPEGPEAEASDEDTREGADDVKE